MGSKNNNQTENQTETKNQTEIGNRGYFRVGCDEYVGSDNGTGIVHQAPAFGEDDLRVCLKNKIIKTSADAVCPVDEVGQFDSTVVDYTGMFIKDADPLIIKRLKEEKRLIKTGVIDHSYPFCERSKKP